MWCPDSNEILGAYRYLPGNQCRFDAQGQPILATSHMFHFSEEFIRDYLPHTIELGRSFVRLEYQSSKSGFKGLYALDNLWDGLGALYILLPEVHYFFGKMTMYPSYDRLARDYILYFLDKHFGDPDRLIIPRHPLAYEHDVEQLASRFDCDDFKADYRNLNQAVRERGLNIPPLVNAYMSLSPTMRMFGTAINDEFGAVEETGILVNIDEMRDEKRLRHIESFAREHPEAIRLTSGANPIIYRPKPTE